MKLPSTNKASCEAIERYKKMPQKLMRSKKQMNTQNLVLKSLRKRMHATTFLAVLVAVAAVALRRRK